MNGLNFKYKRLCRCPGKSIFIFFIVGAFFMCNKLNESIDLQGRIFFIGGDVFLGINLPRENSVPANIRNYFKDEHKLATIVNGSIRNETINQLLERAPRIFEREVQVLVLETSTFLEKNQPEEFAKSLLQFCKLFAKANPSGRLILVSLKPTELVLEKELAQIDLLIQNVRYDWESEQVSNEKKSIQLAQQIIQALEQLE